MAHPFHEDARLAFNHEGLMKQIRNCMEALPDSRIGSNTQYEMSDAALSAFSTFFMQSPSFLAQQRTLQKQKGRSNLNTLFGAYAIPSDNQIRNLLDMIAPEHFDHIFQFILTRLLDTGHLELFNVLDKQLLIALDGTEYFSSSKIHGDCCSTTKQKDGTTRYHHGAIPPVIVTRDKNQVISLSPEFMTPQDGNEKQDGEMAASKRWIEREADQFSQQSITLLGDDLYCHEPFCLDAIEQGWNFIFVCKAPSHKTIAEHVEGLSKIGKVTQFEESHWNGREKIRYQYHYLNHVPIKDDEQTLMINGCEVTISNGENEIIYRNRFATNHFLTQDNVVEIIKAGRSRRKIENENNKTLKTKGYPLEHNFGHGKEHLSSPLATLNILAFLVHTLLGFFDERYQLVREELGSRETFFNDIRALTRYICFDSWNPLLETMREGLEIPIPSK
jgi:hypothetical protein